MSDKEVKIKITGDASDLLKKLERIKDAFDDLGKSNGSNKTINNLLDNLSDVNKEAKKAADNLKDVDNSGKKANNWSNKADDLKNMNKQAKLFADNMKDANKNIGNTDLKQMNKQMDSLGKNGDKIKETFEGINKTADGFSFDTSFFSDANKKLEALSKKVNGGDINSSGLGAGVVEGFVSGTVAGKMLANTMEGVTSGLRDVVAELNNIDDNTPLANKVAMFDKFGKELDEARASAEKLSKEIKDLEEQQTKKNAALNEAKDIIKATDNTDNENRAKQIRQEIEALKDQIKTTERLRDAYNKLHNTAFTNADYRELNSLGDIDDELRRIQKARNEYKGDATSRNFLFPETDLEKYLKQLEKFNKSYKKFMGQVSDGPEEWGGSGKVFDLDFSKYSHSMLDLQEYIDGIDDYIDQYEKEIKRLENLNNRQKTSLGSDSSIKIGSSARTQLSRKKADLAELKEMRSFIEKHMQTYIKAIEDKFDVKIDLPIDFTWDYNANQVQSIIKIQEALEKLRRTQAEYKDELNELENVSDDNGRAEAISKEAQLTKELAELTDRLNKKKEELANTQKDVEVGSAKEKSHIEDLHKQIEAYKKLEEEVRRVMGSEEESVFTQKRLAQALNEAAKSLKTMTNGVKDLDGYDLDFGYAERALEDINTEIREHMKNVKLLDYDNLINDLESFGRKVADKTEKLKELREANSEMDSQARHTVNSIEEESRAIREFADNAGFALKYFKEFAGTERELQLVGNHESLEGKFNPKKIREYNEAIREYLNIINETGSQISKRFLDDDGKFDVNKYIADFERFGRPQNQLIAGYKSLKQQALEYLKVAENIDQEEIDNAKSWVKSAQASKEKAEAKEEEIKKSKEAAEALAAEAKKARDLAKAKLDEAKAKKKAFEDQGNAKRVEIANKVIENRTKELEQAQKKLNDAYIESAAASNKLTDAQMDLAKATDEVSKAQDRLNKAEEPIEKKRQIVKMANEYAKALRELGIAAKDIDLDEIRDFDKSLATNLKDLFPDDMPNTFKEIVEDVKAAFSELGDLEFGNAGDLFKDIGKSLLTKLPASVKIVAALSAGLHKLYSVGKQQFFTGITNAAQKLQPVINAIQSFGREAVTAFESITGTNIDLSSLMELGPNFEHQMQRVGAIAGSNSEQLGKLSDEAKRLGGTTQFTATQVGEAFEYMAMAGWDTNEMLDGMEDVLNLAIASGTDLAKTSDIVTDYMTAMGMSANQTGDFVDKLAATVTSSNTNVEQFGMSMKQVASQAGSLGITMTDLSTAIGLQANAGVKGAKAGTALKNILTNMASPTEKQEKALKKLGFTANKTGGYFELTADDAVDLEATVKKLMTSTDGMTRAQKAATLAQFAGREALPGLMALLSQGADGWDELSATIENSTSKIQYWNECMSLAGLKGDDAVKAIDNMKTVFAETEMEAAGLGLSTEDLSHAIALLGDDGKVSTDNVRDLLDVIESMNTATGKAEEKWRALDGAFNDSVNTGFDYDATIAKLTADTQGLSQATKDQIEEQLKGVDTYEEANAILQEYGLTAERTSFESLSFAQKLDYLRGNLKDTSDEYIKNTLAALGLADSYDEVKEVLDMTQDEFDLYAQNLETVRTMTERLKDTMDETTKASLLTLASAIENACIAAFEKFKPTLQGAANALNEFFNTWHNGETNVFTFEGLELGLAGLAKKIEGQKGNIKNAVAGLFDGLDVFINGQLKTLFSKDGMSIVDSQPSSFDSLLKMGTDMVQSICKGIEQAKNSGSLDSAIDGAIKKICDWITTNAPAIEKAGETIIDSITDGIKNNENAIRDALDSIISIIGSWADSSSALKTTTSKFASSFVDMTVDSIGRSVKEKGADIWNSLFSFGNFEDPESGGLFFTKNPLELIPGVDGLLDGMFGGLEKGLKWAWEGISGWFTSEAHAAELGEEVGTQFSDGYNTSLNTGKETTVATANEIGTGISEGIMSKLESMDATQLQALGTELTNLQTTTQTVATGMGTAFTTIQNSARTSFMGFTNIIRNQMLNCTNIVRNQALNMSNIFRNQFVNVANIVRNQMVNAANIVRNQAVNMANIFRNQFTSMSNVARNQMVNVSNIIRNQAVSWSNVIRNQVTNARNALTQQFISMASVARTQMVNVSNIVRNQAVTWANIVRSQSANIKSAFASAFSGLAAVAARGMAACLSTVRSYMSQIRAATAQTMTMNFKVNKTITTTNVSKSVTQGLASTMGSIARYTTPIAAPQSMAIGGSVGSNRTVAGLGSVESLQLSVPLTVDGREIARATCRYTNDELAKLSKRSNRRKGE